MGANRMRAKHKLTTQNVVLIICMDCYSMSEQENVVLSVYSSIKRLDSGRPRPDNNNIQFSHLMRIVTKHFVRNFPKYSHLSCRVNLVEVQFQSNAVAHRCTQIYSINLITIDSRHPSKHLMKIGQLDEVDGDSGIAKQLLGLIVFKRCVNSCNCSPLYLIPITPRHL